MIKKVIKVLMFVWREGEEGKEFFVLHRKERKDSVILTGHVGDHIEDETLEEAAKREVKEEIGIIPKSIVDLKYKIKAVLKNGKELSTEHAFLIEAPDDKDIKFLEADEKHGWYSLEELPEILTYVGQKKCIKIIKNN